MSSDEQIVGHMNQCRALVGQNIDWIRATEKLDNYTTHVTNLDNNLIKMAIHCLEAAEEVELQLAEKLTGGRAYRSQAATVRKAREILQTLFR